MTTDGGNVPYVMFYSIKKHAEILLLYVRALREIQTQLNNPDCAILIEIKTFRRRWTKVVRTGTLNIKLNSQKSRDVLSSSGVVEN